MGTNKVLRVAGSSPDWCAYRDFVNNIIVDGLANVITVSLEFFLDQIDPVAIEKKGLQPMLEICVPGAAQDEVAARALDHGGRRAHHGHRVERAARAPGETGGRG